MNTEGPPGREGGLDGPAIRCAGGSEDFVEPSRVHATPGRVPPGGSSSAQIRSVVEKNSRPVGLRRSAPTNALTGPLPVENGAVQAGRPVAASRAWISPAVFPT